MRSLAFKCRFRKRNCQPPEADTYQGDSGRWTRPAAPPALCAIDSGGGCTVEIGMGRLSFTADEIAEIRRLLLDLRRADRDRQKAIRARIRRIGFYVTDVTHDAGGFTATDFDALLRRGMITQEADSEEAKHDLNGGSVPLLVDCAQLPVGPLFCVIDGPTRGRAWSASAARIETAPSRAQGRRPAAHGPASAAPRPRRGAAARRNSAAADPAPARLLASSTTGT